MGPNTPQKFSAAKLFGFGGGSNETKKGNISLAFRGPPGFQGGRNITFSITQKEPKISYLFHQ